MSSHSILPNGHITVALCVFNGEATIERATRSLLEQSYEHFDLYVVDDASTDHTFEILKTILPEDRRLHVIRLKKNGGTYSAKNRVLKYFCKGEFFAHQDADDYSWKDRLKKQVEFLRQHPELGACGTGIDEFFQSEKDMPAVPSSYKPEYNPDDGYFHRKNLYDAVIPAGACFEHGIEVLSNIKIAMNGSILFRTKNLKELGGFDGRTRAAGDTELLWRFLIQHPFGNLQEILYSRLFHSGSMTRSEGLGYHSDYRVSYMKKLKARLLEFKKLSELNHISELKRQITQDMYVADSPYQVHHGGVNPAKSATPIFCEASD